MTVDDPQKAKAFPAASADSAEAELVSAGQRVNAGGPAPARRVDYRLRGLDFDASAVRAQLAPPPPVIHKKHPSRVRRRRRLLVQLLVVLALLASTAVVLRAFVLQPYVVGSTSMVPEIQAGTHVLVLRPSLLTGSVKLGDVIVFHQPKAAANCVAGSQDLVKRVIGLPGQKIWSDGQRIYIDGRLLEEPGWYNVPFGELGPAAIPVTTIAPDTYYVMGDNRTDPCDSRSFGAIAGSSIVGKVVASTWRGGHPFAHFV